MCWALFTEVEHASLVLDTVHRGGAYSVCAGHCSQRWCMQCLYWALFTEMVYATFMLGTVHRGGACKQKLGHLMLRDMCKTILKKQETLYIYMCAK